MSHILVPSRGLEDWRGLLADPQKQWRPGKSAYELATSWESARRTSRGLPEDVARVLDNTTTLKNCEVVIALPEHQVVLDGGGHASQTDLWVLLAGPPGLVSVAVEAKAGESFDQMVPQWLKGASERSGKPRRLKQLCSVLGINEDQARLCRYQLLHRTAAAMIEARRFGGSNAMMLVQAFADDPEGLADLKCFAEQLGVAVERDAVTDCGMRNETRLWIGWITCSVAASTESPIT